MAAQSLLAKLGIRLSVEGSAADLAFAFPLATNNPSMEAHTGAGRIGMYCQRTVGDELIGTVVMGVEVMAVGSRGLTSNRSGASQSEAFGLRAGNLTLTGARNTLVGYTAGEALTSGARNTAVGAASLGAAMAADECVAMGYRALANVTSNGSTALGARAGEFMVSGNHNIFLGVDSGDATSNADSNRFVAGSSTGPILDVFFGNGEVHSVPVAYTLHGVGGSGTDIAGANVNIAGGQGTGTGAGGSVVIRTAPIGASSAVANALVDRLTVAGDGGVTWVGITTVSAPAVSAANNGTIFYDATLQKFRYSENGGAYADCFGATGSIGGSIAVNQVAFGSGVDTIQGSALFTFTTASGLVVNLASSGADNLTIGSTAGNSLTSGARNTLLGTNAGTALATVSDVVAVGYDALAACTVAENTAVGSGAADALTTSVRVVAVGFNALGAGTTGVSDSTAVGHNALSLCTGVGNTAVGTNAGRQIVTGTYNTVMGLDAIATGAAGSFNIAIGAQALSVVTGNRNIAVGFRAAFSMVSGNDAVAVGYGALDQATSSQLVAVGANAADAVTTSLRIVAVGHNALSGGVAGVSDSTAIGHSALLFATGLRNTALGSSAGAVTTTGTDNIFLGAYAGDATAAAASNRFVVGSGTSSITSVFLGNGEVNAAPAAVTVNATSGLGNNIAGAALNLAGGRGTGTGIGGAVVFQTAKAGTTGTSLNALTTRVSVLQDGAVSWAGITTADAPAVSAANNGTIFYDSTLQKFQYSENGSAYADCFGAGGGTIGGTIAANQVAYGSGVDTIQGSSTLTYTATAGLALAPTAVATGSQVAFTLTGAANTNQTASTEASDVYLNLARTVEFATGALATQRAVRIAAPTYAAVGASVITTAATVAISGAPAAGTNATITNALAFLVESGISRFDGQTRFAASTSSVASIRITPGVQVTSGLGDGDVWITGTGVFGRVNGATIPMSRSINPLVDAATIAVDASLGTMHTVTLTASRTMGAPTNPADGMMITFKIQQGGAGSYTITWDAIYQFSSNLPSPTLSTAVGAKDYVSFVYDSGSSAWQCISYALGYT